MLHSCLSSVNRTLGLLSALARSLPPKHTEQSGQTKTGMNTTADMLEKGSGIVPLERRLRSPADSFSGATERETLRTHAQGKQLIQF